MKCAMPRLRPRNTERSVSPSVTLGHGPARTKSSHIVGVGTNVFVSCINPPTAIRMTELLHAVLHGYGAWRQIRWNPRIRGMQDEERPHRNTAFGRRLGGRNSQYRPRAGAPRR